MQKICLLGAVFVAIGLTACDQPGGVSPHDLTTARLGEAFDLPLGGAAHLEEVDLDITFTDVTEDSRCPAGAQCIQAGRAVMVFEVAPAEGEAQTVTTTLAADTSEPVEVGDYTLTVTGLNPYPRVEEQPVKEDYVATLIIGE